MKRCSKKVLLICILWIFSNQIIGQPSYIFHHIETSDGLSNNSVHTVLRDRHGFLWIGTESGLNRFDGYGFKVYTMHPGIPNTLISNNIIGLQEDGLGNLWVNFGYGYMVYNRDKDYFISDVIKILKDLGIKAEQN